MRIVNNKGLLGLTALALIAGSFAHAQDTGWYAGANVGRSKARIDDAGIKAGLLGQGFDSVTIDNQSRSTGFKLFTGYQFNRCWGMEARFCRFTQSS